MPRYTSFSFLFLISSAIQAALILFTAQVAHAQTVAGLPENPAAGGFDPPGLFSPGVYYVPHLATPHANGSPPATYWPDPADESLAAPPDTPKNELEVLA